MTILQSTADSSLERSPASVASAQRSLVGALVAAATFIVFLPTLRYGFVFDDEMLILQNVNLTWSRLARLLGAPFWAIGEEGVPAVYRHLGHFYRPVISFSYLLDKTLYGGAPWGFHLANCAMQALAVFLLFRLLLVFFPKLWQAALLALLFGVHPNHTEVVAAIHGRTDLYATVFVLAVVLLYQKRPAFLSAALWVPAFGLAFALALGSKEQSLLVFFLLGAFHFLPEAREWGLTWRSRWGHWLSAAGIALAFFALRANALAGLPALHWTLTPEALLRCLVEVLELMTACLFPWCNYALTSLLRLTPLALTLEIAGCGLVLGVALWRRPRLAALGALWFAGCILVSVWGASAVYEGELDRLSKRYAFLGFFGLLWVLGSCLPQLLHGRRLHAVRSVGALLVLGFATQTLLRNEVYRDSLNFWTIRTHEYPNHELGYYNLGRELMSRGEYKAAEEALSTAVRINPRYMSGYEQVNLALSMMRNGDTERAARVVTEGLALFADNSALLQLDEQLNPERSRAFELIYQRAQTAQAAKHFEESLHLLDALHTRRVNYGVSRFLAGFAHQELNQLDLAIREYDLAVRYTPRHPYTYVNLGYLYLKLQEPERALRNFEQASQLLPSDANVAWGLGEARRLLEVAANDPAHPH